MSAVLSTPCVSLSGCRGTEGNLTVCGDGSIVTGLTSTALAAVNCSKSYMLYRLKMLAKETVTLLLKLILSEIDSILTLEYFAIHTRLYSWQCSIGIIN